MASVNLKLATTANLSDRISYPDTNVYQMYQMRKLALIGLQLVGRSQFAKIHQDLNAINVQVALHKHYSTDMVHTNF